MEYIVDNCKIHAIMITVQNDWRKENERRKADQGNGKSHSR